MGEVYRARDTRLKREVAIKTLPDEFSQDPERLARFQREAEALAALNHPNIAHVYGLEESANTRCIVMELVEGETLQQRLTRGAIPVEEALQIAKQIAEALEVAHERGVIHRDLKPGNIMLTADGKVKVLDFGLAKALQEQQPSNLSNSPTMVSAASMSGVILGTASYMSPEQARGQAADHRSDVFAFGCVLYEMLTGQQAFQGRTVSDILAGVLRVDPDFGLLPKDLNPRLYELLHRCLDKDVKRRWHASADLKIELETVAVDPRGQTSQSGANTQTRQTKLWAAIAVLFLTTVVAVVALIQSARTPRDAQAAMRFLIPSPDKTTFETARIGGTFAGNLSPDGRKIAFTARDEAGKVMVWVRALDTLAARPLQGTEEARLPFWSPDSKSIGFFTIGKLKKIDVDGGPPLTICDAPNGRGGTWNRDGVILFAPNNPATTLWRVSSAGGEPKAVTIQGQSLGMRFPFFLPDGKHFLFADITTANDNRNVTIGSLDSPDTHRLFAADSPAIYALPGYLLFMRQGTLLAQPFDAKKLELAGAAVPIAEQVANDTVGPAFSASDNGTLAYRTGFGGSEKQLVWLDRNGKTIEIVGVPAALYQSPAISPDGKRIAVHRHEGNGGDVWIIEAATGKASRLTFDPSQENSQPIWSGDGARIVFGSYRNSKWGIYEKLSNFTGREELLYESDALNVPLSWSAVANTVLFGVADSQSNADVWAVPLNGDRKPVPLLQTSFIESHPQISPNGRWFSYTSNETGRSEIYVQSFPLGGGKWQISSNGGVFSRWRPDGKELFYMEGASLSKIMAVTVHDIGSTIEFASADGQRFLIPRTEAMNTGTVANTPITLVLNWPVLLKK
jgi:Tol biopolymer transport system component